MSLRTALRTGLWAAVFALGSEVGFKVLGRPNPAGLCAAMGFHAVFVPVAVVVLAGLRRVGRRVWTDLAVALGFGLFGLAFEWGVMGNAPWRNPQASQLVMLAMWASVGTMPWLLEGDDPRGRRVARVAVGWFAVVWACAVPAVLAPQPARFVWALVAVCIAYAGLVPFWVVAWVWRTPRVGQLCVGSGRASSVSGPHADDAEGRG